MKAKPILTALLSGLVFGVGLCISGMTDPKNVLAFLDVAGAWSPNLAGVMLGAITVHAAWLRFGAKQRLVPAKSHVDAALVAGAALFGIGWGLAGYCPGPAIVALGSGALGTLAFVAAMLLGMLGERALRKPSLQ